MSEWVPTTATELSRMVEENFRGEQHALSAVGGRTALHYGGRVNNSAIISLNELSKVIDYPARDMTITVETGIRIEKLNEILAQEQQRLPIDIPQSHRATLGGAVACDASGPSRFGYGTFRDYVIGMTAIDGQGRLFSAGGRVVKNVAGYDLCKLMIGSLGTLGIITQLTLKTRPLVRERSFVLVGFQTATEVEATLDRLNLSQTRPVIVDVLNPKATWQIQAAKRCLPRQQFGLCVGYEGTESEVAWQVDQLQQELDRDDALQIAGADAKGLWKALTEYQAASDDPVSFQASVPPSRVVSFLEQATQQEIALQAHAGNGVIVGHLPDRCANAQSAMDLMSPLRQFAESHHGQLVVINADEEWGNDLNVFGTPKPAWEHMRRIKLTLDPAQLMNPGRLDPMCVSSF